MTEEPEIPEAPDVPEKVDFFGLPDVPDAPTADEPAPKEGSAEPTQTLWHGRFAGGPADELLAFTVSLSFDQRLALDDLAGSAAHVAGLARAELISDFEAAEVFVALDQVEQELTRGDFPFAPTDEDIHTAIERRVTELAGDAGAKLHTGRSRNDQVATALRLWCKRELEAIAGRVVDLQRVLLDRAREAGSTYLPGYTHLQRAQPVLLAHHLLAHGWALARDVDRLADCVRRLDVSPLGAGALAGSSLPLDPAFTAEQLGFARPFDNSLDAVSDRDFVAEALFDLSLLAVHLSRMGEEVVLWTTAEFGFARLDDAYATGSSMLPQKKNADIAELARGKAGRVIGNLTGLLVTLKGLPLAYNRDLQEDKEPLFDAVDQVSLALGAMAGLYRTLEFEPRRMQAAADSPDLAATDMAEWLVGQGMPFRQAHAIVGELVRRSIDQGTPLEDLIALHPDLGPEPARFIGEGRVIQRRTSPGAAGPGPVAIQLEAFAAHVEALTKPTPPPVPVPVEPEPKVSEETTAEAEPDVTEDEVLEAAAPEFEPEVSEPEAAEAEPELSEPEVPEDGAPEEPDAATEAVPDVGSNGAVPDTVDDAEAVPEPEPDADSEVVPEADDESGLEADDEPAAEPEASEDEEPEPAPVSEVPPLASAFVDAAVAALEKKEEVKPVSGEFDLGEFGQFVAGLDLDKTQPEAESDDDEP
ncbi:MAG TPA: argininosuccinate lyase [Acidimicrobiales bacterium]|nr:argininosuccinate lyase [Acidimicrobiales bacterium]